MCQKIIDTTILIAIVTFLWYRRGRLWSFYYSVVYQSLEQIKSNSLDSSAWEKIAFENLDFIVKNLFGALFEFEIEYLRNKIIDKQYLLWVADSSTSGEKIVKNGKVKWVNKSITITDKEEFCIHSLKKTFYNDFRFFGFLLFVRSIFYRIRKKENKGYTERNSETSL